MSPFFSLWDMAVSLFCYVGESFAAVVFLKKFFQSSRQKKNCMYPFADDF